MKTVKRIHESMGIARLRDCSVCGRQFFSTKEIEDCEDRDMIRFIYEKLGGKPMKRQ